VSGLANGFTRIDKLSILLMAFNQDIVLSFLSSKLEWRNFEMFMSSIFVKSEYCKSNRSLQSWDKFG
jgi:hypothetical protein